MKLSTFIKGLFATALAILAFGIFAKVVWNLWDSFIEWLILKGFPPQIEYVIGGLILVIAVWLGLLQLKEVKK